MVDLIGFAHSPFGKLPGAELEKLMQDVAGTAVADAGLSGADIDAVVVGHFNPGLVPQGFTAGLTGGLLPGLQMKPSVRVENACATGSAAVHHTANLVRAGEAKRVLVIGVEIMSDLPTREVGNALLQACYVREERDTPAGFAGSSRCWPMPTPSALATRTPPWPRSLQRTMPTVRSIRWPSCAPRWTKRSAPANPSAIRVSWGACSPISDGAAALVVCASDAHNRRDACVRLRATAQATDLMPLSQRDMSELAGTRAAWGQLMQRASITLADLDLLETHDCFTIAELMQYEAIGLCAPGRGLQALEEG